ncbi:unnamed protein product [Aphanomyces euteiches]|uniref:Macro domain-containing protein n=1 Tax=Aphanomyces euteiches TaxID=100861 RepID=A0A6G0XI59_9STRA|nr:hypothetical protein Ae201684_004558 [Aphanomyces euteiches]KAH9094043.1 hypothetical protein Ae201684P_016660 [Aphanomyces euteiches]KAH9133624.1 hypothetical protein AeRB84_020339 [Aphanomyces euteiches]
MSDPKKPRADLIKNGPCFRTTEIWLILLPLCDLETTLNLALVIFSDPSLWDVARRQSLWEDLIETHFHQKRYFPPGAPLPVSSSVPNFQGSKKFQPSAAFVEFCETTGERSLFDNVQILQGDIGSIKDINNVPVDCLIFPTNYTLRNAGSGAAVAVFHRAGPDLDDHVKALNYHGKESDAVVTPGFNAGVKHLVHCVGPSPHTMGSFPLLYQTYLNAFGQALRNKSRCVAIASIATGTLGFPLGAATNLAIRALRDFIKTHRWNATVAFVCFDGTVAEAMRTAKNEVLHEFNFHSFQAMALV